LTPAQLESAKGQAIVAYTIAEEGESHPVVLGEGAKKLNWGRAVIHRLGQIVKSGTKLFNRHNADNSTTGRKSVGEVITSYTKEISGRLRTIAIACMDKVDSVIYDICSIEAEILENNGYVSDVEKVTGIAISNSKIDNPAFINAKRMQIVQCFSEEEPRKAGEAKNMLTLEDIMQAPIGLLQQAVTARQIHPSQLFSLKDYENDNELSGILKERTTLQSKVEELETSLNTQKDLLAKAERTTSLATAKDLLKERLPEGLTKKQSDFIANRFEPEKFDVINEESIDDFIKSSQKDFSDFAKMFGGESDGEEIPDEDFKESGSDPLEDLQQAFLEE
jgi:hypothetical protein